MPAPSMMMCVMRKLGLPASVGGSVWECCPQVGGRVVRLVLHHVDEAAGRVVRLDTKRGDGTRVDLLRWDAFGGAAEGVPSQLFDVAAFHPQRAWFAREHVDAARVVLMVTCELRGAYVTLERA